MYLVPTNGNPGTGKSLGWTGTNSVRGRGTMDWQCAKCGEAVPLAEGESISDATRRHSRDAIHPWVGAQRTLPDGTEQRWLTPSERADRPGRGQAARLNAGDRHGVSDVVAPARGGARRGFLTTRRRGRMMKPSGGKGVRRFVGIAFLLAGLSVGVATFAVGSDENADRSPPEQSTNLYPGPSVSPSGTYAPAAPHSPGDPVPTPPGALRNTAPTYVPESGKGSDFTGGRARDTRDNSSYYDGRYDNDAEWHRKYGNPDEYYDGNYDNDSDYHRKYGRN